MTALDELVQELRDMIEGLETIGQGLLAMDSTLLQIGMRIVSIKGTESSEIPKLDRLNARRLEALAAGDSLNEKLNLMLAVIEGIGE
jgi:hypothetical protein